MASSLYRHFEVCVTTCVLCLYVYGSSLSKPAKLNTECLSAPITNFRQFYHMTKGLPRHFLAHTQPSYYWWAPVSMMRSLMVVFLRVTLNGSPFLQVRRSIQCPFMYMYCKAFQSVVISTTHDVKMEYVLNTGFLGLARRGVIPGTPAYCEALHPRSNGHPGRTVCRIHIFLRVCRDVVDGK